MILSEISFAWRPVQSRPKAHAVDRMAELSIKPTTRDITVNINMGSPLSGDVRMTTNSAFMERGIVSDARPDCLSEGRARVRTIVEVQKIDGHGRKRPWRGFRRSNWQPVLFIFLFG